MPVQINPCLVYTTGYPDKHLVMDMPTFQRMVHFLRESPALVWDFETSGLDWFKSSRACGIGLGGWKTDGTLDLYYVPFRHATGEKQLAVEQIGPSIKELLGDPNKLKIAHNMKFDEHFANEEGWEIAGPRYDTMIAARLYDENRKAGLKIRAVQDLGRADAQLYEKRINEEVYRLAKAHGMPVADYRNAFGYSQINIPLCGTYCCFDLEFTAHLHLFYEAAGISRLYSRIWQTEMELIGVLTRMEARGMAIDTEYLETLRDALGGILASLEDSIWHQLGGFQFNLSSDAELREVLMKRLGIRLSKLTKKGQFAVDKEVLSQHVDAHPVLRQIIDWREAEKLRSTYTNSILMRLDANLTLHPDYQQVGTFTGRLSCMNPNFQNQPSDSDDRAQKFSGKSLEEGGRDPWSIRRAYVVGKPGWVRLYFDYSQIELRVLAYYSGDPVMVGAYVNGEDIHERTSLEVFGTKEKAKRRPSKVINFGLSYCMTAKGYSVQTGIPLNEAEKHLAKFFQRYHGIMTFRNKFWDEVRRRGGYFQNIFGRPRKIKTINSSDEIDRTKAERRAIATIIQGTAAELTKESLVKVDRFLRERNLPAYIVATVHDEIQIDCRISVMTEVSRGVKAIMEDFSMFSPIPIIVDCEYSTTSWADKSKVQL